MKIRVLSDLHVDVATWEPPPAEADVVVIAGDIKNGSGGFVWARKHFPDAEIVAILGNHEYYGGALDKTPSVLRQEASRAGLKLLDCDEVVLGKVRFIGCTLWTDFRLNADNPSIQDPRERDAIAEYDRGNAERNLSDFAYIYRDDFYTVAPRDLVELHQKQRKWLDETLAQSFGGRTVVVTHHAPSAQSVKVIWRCHEENYRAAAYASDLRDMMGAHVDLWIHGHVHASLEYVERGTRVVCNGRGDGRRPWSAEVFETLAQAAGLSFPPGSAPRDVPRPGSNPNFNPTLVIEV